jgi:hypothetical protein
MYHIAGIVTPSFYFVHDTIDITCEAATAVPSLRAIGMIISTVLVGSVISSQ